MAQAHALHADKQTSNELVKEAHNTTGAAHIQLRNQIKVILKVSKAKISTLIHPIYEEDSQKMTMELNTLKDSVTSLNEENKS